MNINKTIHTIFKRLGLKTQNIGYIYARDFIKDCVNNDGLMPRLTKWYADEAVKYQKNAPSIERAIRHFASNMTNPDLALFEEIFGSADSPTRKTISTKSFLFNVAHYILANEIYDDTDDKTNCEVDMPCTE